MYYQISINNTFDTLIPTKASKKKVNNNNSNNNSNNNNTSFHILHDDQENTVQNTEKQDQRKLKTYDKEIKTVFKSPLRTTNHKFVHSPMPRI